MQASDLDRARVLEEKFDPEMRFRPIRFPAALIVTSLLIVLSCFHYYTAGFGLLRETTHRGVHLSFVLGLVFLVFPLRKKMLEHPPAGFVKLGGVPWYDWIFAVAVAISVLYIPYVFDGLAFRVGNPNTLDVALGSVLVVLLLEATRRAMGWPLPIIALIFMTYALAGPIFPGLFKHSGASWPSLINHLYLTSQGIYGIAVGVVATYVFHFVLFGVLATAIGLGQLFIDIASSIAGPLRGRTGQGVGIRVGDLRHAVGVVGGQCGDRRVADDSRDDSPGLPAALRRRRRGRVVDGRADHAADHGRRGIPDDRVPEPAVFDDHRRGDRAGVHALLRRVHAGAFRGEEQRPARPYPGRAAGPAQGAEGELAHAHPAGPPRDDHRAGQHAVSRRVHRHLVVHPGRLVLVAAAHDGDPVRRAAGVARTAARADYPAVRQLRPVGIRAAGRGDATRPPRDRTRIAHRPRGDPRSVRTGGEIRAGRRRRGGHRRHRDRRGHVDRRGLQAVVHRDRRRPIAGRRGRRVSADGLGGPARADIARRARDDGTGMHPDGLRHTHDRQLHHHGDRRGTHARAAGRAADRRAFLRVLLRRAGGHNTTGGARCLRRGRHGRVRSVQDRQHGVQAGAGQGAGAFRVRVRAIDADRRQGLRMVRSSSSRPSAACSASRSWRRRCRIISCGRCASGSDCYSRFPRS